VALAGHTSRITPVDSDLLPGAPPMPELVWQGKYDDGHRAAPLRTRLPFQTVETINESAQQRQLGLNRLVEGRDPEWRNRLIWGDNKYVLPSLLDEFAGKVALIYIDPPCTDLSVGF
jgi:hypothetical protein